MEERKLRCPNCKGTKFSVKVYAFQTYFSDIDSWENVEVDDVMDTEDTYFCCGCDCTFQTRADLEFYN